MADATPTPNPTPTATPTPTPTATRVKRQTHLEEAGQSDDGVDGLTVWLVEFSADATTEAARVATDGTNSVPLVGSGHPEVFGISCRRSKAQAIDQNTRRSFQVRCEYARPPGASDNPLNDPPQIEWDFSEDGTQPYFVDCSTPNPKRVLNTAHDQFSDFLQRSTGSITATFSVNMTPAAAAALAHTAVSYFDPVPPVNSDGFTFDGLTVAAGQARLKGVSVGGKQTRNGTDYRVFKASLAFRPTWDDVIDSLGFHELVTVGGDNSLQPILDASNAKVERPWPLDQNGAAMPNADDTPATLTFKPYPAKPYSVFNFQ